LADGLIKHLQAEIDANNLVLVCGAGVAIAASGNQPQASWAGLIEHGLEWCASNEISLPGKAGLKRAQADLRSGDFLSAADKLQRGLEEAGEWTRFLNDSFKSLLASSWDLVDALLELNVPIATTNYDTLIDGRAGLPAVSWRSPGLVGALRNRSQGIAHLHGVWTDPASVILSHGSYGQLIATEQTMAVQRAVAIKSSMLFVGVGAGLDDPNFGTLSRYLEREFRDSGLLHVRLAKSGDRLPPTRPPVRNLRYGRTPAELAPFIRRLRPRGHSQRRASGDDDTHNQENAEAAAAALLRAPLLRGFGPGGPTLRALWPELLIDLRVRSQRSLGVRDVSSSEWIAAASPDESVCVIGEPGAGKSTLLAQICIAGASQVGRRPRYLEAKRFLAGQGTVAAGDWVLLDGLDELGLADQKALAGLVSAFDRVQWWFACRVDFFERVTPLREALDGCDELMRIMPLAPSQVDSFLERFSLRSSEAARAAVVVNDWRSNVPFSELLLVPLNLVLSLYLATLPTGDRTSVPRSRFELYASFYHYWLEHESDRLRLGPRQRSAIETQHSDLALELYGRRQLGRSEPVRIRASAARTQEVLLALTSTRRTGGFLEIYQFVHETIMEYVLARGLVRVFEGEGAGRASHVLDAAFNDDVNGFVRDAVSSFDIGVRTKIAETLTAMYRQSASPRVREHLLYYLGRLNLSSCPAILMEAYFAEQEFLLRRSAALGAILHGESEIEHHFMEMLSSDAEASELNRAVQLV
jgi:hypothetical protein